MSSTPAIHHAPIIALRVALACACFLAPVWSDEPGKVVPAEQRSVALERELNELFRERESEQALDARIQRAQVLGASKQAILEARFLYHVDHQNRRKLIALLPELAEQNQSFDLSESEIFALKDDWLAILEYIRALDALERNDDAAFKKHITEAFWLSPQQSAAYTDHIEKFKRQRAMRQVTFDFTHAFTTLDGRAAEINLTKTDKRALLLHFFSPWSRENQATLDEFFATAKALNRAHIAVVTILVADDQETVEDTLELLAETPKDARGRWLIDPGKPAISQQLRVTSAPTMVLVAPDGRILFNGHPTEPELWSAVKKIAPEFVRPKAPEEMPGE